MERKDFRSSPAQGYASESRLGRRVNRATTFSGIQASRREVKERKTICKKVSINNVPRSWFWRSLVTNDCQKVKWFASQKVGRRSKIYVTFVVYIPNTVNLRAWRRQKIFRVKVVWSSKRYRSTQQFKSNRFSSPDDQSRLRGFCFFSFFLSLWPRFYSFQDAICGTIRYRRRKRMFGWQKTFKAIAPYKFVYRHISNSSWGKCLSSTSSP